MRRLLAADRSPAPLRRPAGRARAKDVPPLTGRVVDQASLLSPEQRQRIETQLAALEKQTGDQLAVLTVDSLDGDPIEDFANKTGRAWALGQKGKNNGVILLVAKDGPQDADRGRLRPRARAHRPADQHHPDPDHHPPLQAGGLRRRHRGRRRRPGHHPPGEAAGDAGAAAAGGERRRARARGRAS